MTKKKKLDYGNENNQWYAYEIQTDEDMTDGGTSLWANASLNGIIMFEYQDMYTK